MYGVLSALFTDFLIIAIIIFIGGAILDNFTDVDLYTASKLIALTNIIFGIVLAIALRPAVRVREIDRETVNVPVETAYEERTCIIKDNNRIDCEVRIDNNSEESYYVREQSTVLWKSIDYGVIYVGTKGNEINISNIDNT